MHAGRLLAAVLLAATVHAQPVDRENRTPNLKLRYGSDERTNNNWAALDSFAGTLLPLSNPEFPIFYADQAEQKFGLWRATVPQFSLDVATDLSKTVIAARGLHASAGAGLYVASAGVTDLRFSTLAGTNAWTLASNMAVTPSQLALYRAYGATGPALITFDAGGAAGLADATVQIGTAGIDTDTLLNVEHTTPPIASSGDGADGQVIQLFPEAGQSTLGVATGGDGGNLLAVGGGGGTAASVGGSGGAGGPVFIQGGSGGIGGATGDDGAGGNVQLTPGSAGNGPGDDAPAGSVILMSSNVAEGVRVNAAGVRIGPGTSLDNRFIDTVLSDTIVHDFASVTAGCTAAVTLTITGAADGDPVSVGVPNSGMGTPCVFQAWVSAANTVSLKACSVGAAACDPLNVTYRILVTSVNS